VEAVMTIVCSPDVLNAREATTVVEELWPVPELKVSPSIRIVTS